MPMTDGYRPLKRELPERAAHASRALALTEDGDGYRVVGADPARETSDRMNGTG